MASSSISSIQKSFKYDLFLSFRGEDTRTNFVDHLYVALQRQGIHTFKDDKKLEKGKRIDNELIKAIENSKMFIIVFSKNYASSTWCLDELVKIIECQRTTETTAYPLFYDVEPTEVRKQRGTFGEAFGKHKSEESFETWKKALKEAADLAGWELKKTANGHEAEFIKQIVKELSLKLRAVNFSVDEKLVGMESRVKDVELLLETGFDDVRMIGIKGMGGGGKTTLARALFDKISRHFEGKSFVENVREVSQPSLTGLKSLQKQVLSDVLQDKDINVNSVDDGKNMMKKMLSSRKVLLVLDNVDHIQQLEALAGERSWFMAGSKVIITTRDEQVLLAHRVNGIHSVNLLSNDEANCLFSRYAFGRDTPIQGYEDLSLKFVSYVAGLPLTIKVLGSFLCGKDELEWIDALGRLKTIPEKETTQILELSYMSLEDDYKEIFLNVVCFTEAWLKDDAIHVLECCGFHARISLKVLEHKSLITIFQDDFDRECIGAHDLIREMGRNIVRRVNPDEPSTHSRLWISNEIEHILANSLGTEATKYINVGQVESFPAIFMKGFKNMKKLLFLNICVDEDAYFSTDGTYSEDELSLEYESFSDYMEIYYARQNFPNSLRYLCWDGYPHWCLPSSFQPDDLVGLRMRGSRIKQLWEYGERMVMKKLKFLDFTCSMLKTFDLEMAPNLESLDLKKCAYLSRLETPLGRHLKLNYLYVSKSKLRTIDLRMAQNLETLDLHACHHLVELHLPLECPKLTSLNLKCLSKLRELNLGLTPNLEEFHVVECYDLSELHMHVGCLKLKFLTLRLSTLTTLDLGHTPNLEKLWLEKCHIMVEFQELINGCPKLTSLKIISSNLKTLNLGVAQNLEELYLERCPDLVEFYMPISCLKLRSLDLYLVKLRTLEFGQNTSLQNLRLAQCHDLSEVHMPVGCPALVTLSITQCYNLVKLHTLNGCPNLRNLYLRNTKLRTLDIELIPDLEELELQGCDELVELQLPLNGFPNLTNLHLQHLKLRTLNLQPSSNLCKFVLKECNELVELQMPVNTCPNLTNLNLQHSKLRTLDLLQIPNLQVLDLQECNELVELQMPVNGFPNLTRLCAKHLKLRSIDLRLAADLYSLDIQGCHNLLEFHMPVKRCSKLTYLFLRHVKLRTLDLRLTPNLHELKLQECDELVELQMPVNESPKLTELYLRHLKLKTLNLQLSPNLERLDIEDCHELVQLKLPLDCSNLKSLNLHRSVLRNLDPVMGPYFRKLHIAECYNQVQHNAPIGCVKGLECIDLSGHLRLKNFLLESSYEFGVIRLDVESKDVCPLDTDHSFPKFRFSCVYQEHDNYIQDLSSTTRNLQKLVSLANCCIRNFRSFSESICGIQSLVDLKLQGSIPEMPKHLEQLGNLRSLVFTSIETTHLPDSICMLKRLRTLELESCLLLEMLPEDIGRLECLEKLIINKCTSLTDIPISICEMKQLQKFDLSFCVRVKKLPEELGRLECLKELNIKGSGIIRLPNSISLLKDLRVVGSLFVQTTSRGLADLLTV